MKYVLPTLAVLVIVPILQKTVVHNVPFGSDRLRCVIAPLDGGAGVMNYPVGYNYEMLHLFAAQIGADPDIFLGGREYLDSLADGTVDIVVLPYSDSLVNAGGLLVSIPLADSSAWVTGEKAQSGHKEINLWLSRFFLSREQEKTAQRFTPSYEPFSRVRSGRKYSVLSPYDDLIRRHSAEMDWDPLMLTALVWQESRFRIEASSRRGARGLMQLMPNTAGAYKADDLLNPEVSISTGILHLRRLRRIFAADAEDRDELLKFTLAAYNAGEGRIRDCISYAASIGAPHTKWNDIAAVIPDMREDAILDSDTVKLGKFNGRETIRYVESILALYDAFRAIAHGQSSPDRYSTRKSTAAEAAALSRDTTDSPRQELEAH